MCDIFPWFGEVNTFLVVAIGFVTLSWVVAKWRASRVQAANVPDVQVLSSELTTVVDWHKLGLNLGIPKHELDKIERDYRLNDRQRLEMLHLWLRHTPYATWEDVVSALQQMGENMVAERIRQKYKGGSKFGIWKLSSSMVEINKLELYAYEEGGGEGVTKLTSQ